MWPLLTILCFGTSLALDLMGQDINLVIAGIICGWISLATTSIISHLYEDEDDDQFNGKRLGGEDY